jgi:acyl-CoA thioesterase YciA
MRMYARARPAESRREAKGAAVVEAFKQDCGNLYGALNMASKEEKEGKVTLPEGKEPVLRVVPMPSDANFNGDIFGGWIMSQVDIAGSIPAVRLAQGRVTTVAVNSFVFKQPVFIGDLVSFYSEVERVGRTSITVAVEVFAHRHWLHEIVKVTEATLTYVAVDEQRRPRPVHPAQGA